MTGPLFVSKKLNYIFRQAGSLKKFHNSYFIIISMPWAIPSSAFDFVIYFA